MLTTRRKIAIARVLHKGAMAARRIAGRGHETRVRRNGIAWQLDLREGIDFAIWLTGAFEPGTQRAYKKFIRSGGVALDIGANIGAHTLSLARAVGPTGKVYAFEPTDFAMEKLRRNLALNPDLEKRVVCAQVMLMDRRGAKAQPLYASWPLGDTRGVHALHRGRKKQSGKARATTLDAFLAKHRVGRVDFIKLDIDGFECSMLKGARRTLKRWRPAMVLELSPHQLDEQGGSIEELTQILRKAGYALRQLGSGAELPLDGGALRAFIPHGGGCNAAALPRPQLRAAGKARKAGRK
jgi:FkbM family methyltransferase